MVDPSFVRYYCPSHPSLTYGWKAMKELQGARCPSWRLQTKSLIWILGNTRVALRCNCHQGQGGPSISWIYFDETHVTGLIICPASCLRQDRLRGLKTNMRILGRHCCAPIPHDALTLGRTSRERTSCVNEPARRMGKCDTHPVVFSGRPNPNVQDSSSDSSTGSLYNTRGTMRDTAPEHPYPEDPLQRVRRELLSFSLR